MSEVEADTGDSEISEVWNQIQRSDDPDEREFLLERLGLVALNSHDFSDPEIHDEVHHQFEQMRRVREDFHLVAVRLGRLVARMMDDHEMRARMTAHTDRSGAN